MIQTNLSTRPFYNERAVHALAALLAILILAVTAWQVARVVTLSRYKTELNASISRDKAEADRSTREAEQIHRGLDQKQLAALAASAKEARDLIAARTFSWTELFNQIEATLPDDVMLVGVQPKIDAGVIQVHMDLQGKDEEAITEFWDRLEKTGQFHEPTWSNVDTTPEGYYRMAMNVSYTPNAPATRPAAVTR